jgi:hypothetical protein
MENSNEMVFVKGNEAIIIKILIFIAILLLIIPITLIFLFRFIYRSIQIVKEQTKVGVPVNGILENV